MAPSLRTDLVLVLASVAGSCAGGGEISAPATNPPPPPTFTPALAGLVGAAAGTGMVRVQWREPPAGYEVALFASTAGSGSVYADPPLVAPLADAALTVSGLVDGTTYSFGLGIRAVGTSAWTPTGVVLGARPGAPVYVDRGASAPTPDGLTPATAFSDVTSGLLTAFARGGGNVWVAEGDYDVAFLPLFSGVHVQGGFQPGFDLAERDALSGKTAWIVATGSSGVGVQGGDPHAVLDGIALLGRGVASIGVDVVDSGLELRAVSVSGFTDRGIRLRNSEAEDYDLVVAASSVSSNGSDGVSLVGAYDAHLDGSTFASNGQEGIDLAPLVALDGDTARLEITACGFHGNADEGLDASLDAPPLGGSTGGRFRVEVRGSVFEANGADGCLLDIEYDAFPLWNAELLVRESAARANRGAGFHVDADAKAEVFFHRLLATANAGDGMLLSSEGDPGIAIAAACVAAANLGSAFRATVGQRTLVASHCIAAGNLDGGFTCDTVEGSIVSSLAWLQTVPGANVRTTASTSVLDPFEALFEHAPEEYRVVVATNGSSLVLDRAPDFPGSAALELADDGLALLAAQISGTNVGLASAPNGFVAPGSLAAFAPGTGVDEDYRIPVGSPAQGSGMTPPGGPAVDAGVYGAPLGGEPGAADAVPPTLFRPVATTPAPAVGLGANDPIVIAFSDELAAASVVPDAVRAVTTSGGVLAISTQVVNGELVIDPPSGGWGSEPFEIDLHRGLASTGGDPLASPVALPFTP